MSTTEENNGEKNGSHRFPGKRPEYPVSGAPRIRSGRDDVESGPDGSVKFGSGPGPVPSPQREAPPLAVVPEKKIIPPTHSGFWLHGKRRQPGSNSPDRGSGI